MIHIDSLHMRLPTGFQHRAQNIVHLVTASLGDMKVSGEHRLEQLSIPAIQVSGHATDRDIAQSIATKIAAELRDQR